MKKALAVLLLFLVAVGGVISVNAGKIDRAPAAKTDFAVYTTLAWNESVKSFESFLTYKGLTYKEITSWDVNHRNLSKLYNGIFMPGGWAGNYWKYINSQGEKNIRELVRNGGAYVGASAGAYYASDKGIWSDDNGATWNTYDYPLNLFDGSAKGPIPEIAPWPEYAMTIMDINTSHPANVYEPANETIYYQGEPIFIPNSPASDMQVFARWRAPNTAWADEQPGIIGANYGFGRVLLIGPHPEIEEDSLRDGSAYVSELDDNGSDWPFLWTAMDWVMRKQVSQPLP